MSFNYFEKNITNGVYKLFGTGAHTEWPEEPSLEWGLQDLYYMLGSDISDCTIFYGSKEDTEKQMRDMIDIVNGDPEKLSANNDVLYFVHYHVSEEVSVLICNWSFDYIEWVVWPKTVAMFYAGAHHSDLDMYELFATIISKNKFSKGMKKFNTELDMDNFFEYMEMVKENELYDETPEEYKLQKELKKFDILTVIGDIAVAFDSIGSEFEGESGNQHTLMDLKAVCDRAKQIRKVMEDTSVYHHCKLICTVGNSNKFYQMDYDGQYVDIKNGRNDNPDTIQIQDKEFSSADAASKFILDKCAKKIKSGGYELVELN